MPRKSVRKAVSAMTLGVATLAAALSMAGCATVAGPALPNGAVAIARQGSFEAGGKILGNSATSSLSCDHGHVEYEIPVGAKQTALFLWHSSSAAVWQRR